MKDKVKQEITIKRYFRQFLYPELAEEGAWATGLESKSISSSGVSTWAIKDRLRMTRRTRSKETDE